MSSKEIKERKKKSKKIELIIKRSNFLESLEKKRRIEYIPFGEEWEKEMNKFTKKDLIDLLRKQWQKRK